MNDWGGWNSWFGILAVAAVFGADKNIIDSILKGDETMEEKIAKIKELILDKVTTKVEKEDLTIDEYSKVVSLFSQISYDPKSIYTSLGKGFNGGFGSAPKTETAETKE